MPVSSQFPALFGATKLPAIAGKAGLADRLRAAGGKKPKPKKRRRRRADGMDDA